MHGLNYPERSSWWSNCNIIITVLVYSIVLQAWYSSSCLLNCSLITLDMLHMSLVPVTHLLISNQLQSFIKDDGLIDFLSNDLTQDVIKCKLSSLKNEFIFIQLLSFISWCIWMSNFSSSDVASASSFNIPLELYLWVSPGDNNQCHGGW